jgi:hypothetical protein
MPDTIRCRCTNVSIPIPTADGVDGETREVQRDQVTIVRTFLSDRLRDAC